MTPYFAAAGLFLTVLLLVWFLLADTLRPWREGRYRFDSARQDEEPWDYGYRDDRGA